MKMQFVQFWHTGAMDDFGYDISYHYGLARQHITARALRFILLSHKEEH